MESRKLIDFLKVYECGRLCVNFLSVAVYNSAVMGFWPLPFKQRKNLFLRFLKAASGQCNQESS